MKRGDVAKRLGVSVSTVRKWQDTGALLSRVDRAGQHVFDERDVAQLEARRAEQATDETAWEARREAARVADAQRVEQQRRDAAQRAEEERARVNERDAERARSRIADELRSTLQGLSPRRRREFLASNPDAAELLEA